MEKSSELLLRSALHDMANVLAGVRGIVDLNQPGQPLSQRDRDRLEAVIEEGVCTLNRCRHLTLDTLPDSLLGRLGDGLKVGDRFQVVEATPDVVHPVTGKVIPGAPKVIGELKVISLGAESSIMKASGLKGPLKAGQFVESLMKKAGAWESFMDKVIK